MHNYPTYHARILLRFKDKLRVMLVVKFNNSTQALYVTQECEFITVKQPIGLENISDVINNTIQTYTMFVT